MNVLEKLLDVIPAGKVLFVDTQSGVQKLLEPEQVDNQISLSKARNRARARDATKRLTAAAEAGDEVAEAGLRARLEWLGSADLESRRAEIIENGNLDETEMHRRLAELDEDVLRKQESPVEGTLADQQADLAKRQVQKRRTVDQANALLEELVKRRANESEAAHDTHYRLGVVERDPEYAELYQVLTDAQRQ